MFRRKVSFLVFIFCTVVLISSGCSKQNSSSSTAIPPSSSSSSSPSSSSSLPSSSTQVSAAAADLFARAESFELSHDLLKAKEAYEQILTEHSDFDKIDVVQDQLGDLNLKLLYSKTMIEGKTVMHEIKIGDTLGKIAKQYGTTVNFIKRSNGLERDTIRVGDRLRIWTAPFSIAVDKSQNVLLFKTGDEILKVYIVATGKDNSTPVGEFTITTKLENPTWYKSGAVVAPNSPENALGTRWMGFDLKGYGIHGTIEPESMGQQATAGCVRMLNEQVEQLYDMIPAGTKVTITD